MSTASAELRRCGRCRNAIDPEDLFCANCGTEAPLHEHEAAARAHRPEWEVFAFHCRGCGASMSFDARQGALSCPFCGATEVEAEPSTEGVVYPERMIPYGLGREGAVERFREWLGVGFWRPGDLKEAAAIDGMRALFLPCWSFSGNTDTCWAADVGARTRSGWHPRSGSHVEAISGVLVPASHGLGPAELQQVDDFRFEGLIPTEHRFLQGAVVEAFGLTRKAARGRARAAFERVVSARITRKLRSGKVRNVHCNVLLADLSSEPILLPLWIFAYRYKGKPYRFVMNGQTGSATGKAPFSYFKLAALVAAVLGLTGGVLALVACAGVLSQAL
jgi:hypothetical protein